MHELSVVREIIEIVEGEMTRRGLRRIEAVSLRLGKLAGVNPDALSFGFETSVVGTALDGARLSIDLVPVRAFCRSCAKEFGVDDLIFFCPYCGATEIKVLSGEELDIDHLVVE